MRGVLTLISTQPLTWGATLLTTIMLPRYPGDHGLGQYALAFTIAGRAASSPRWASPANCP